MEYLLDSWSLVVILVSAFVIGWGAETAQTFIPRAVALSLLAWLQTLPEFAVEAQIAWNQQRDLMIANLTGSLRLLVGLGWPLIFFVHFFFHGMHKRPVVKEITLEAEDYLGVMFLFISILYFCVILAKGSLTIWDSVVLTIIYVVYLWIGATKFQSHEAEEEDDLPWIGKHIVKLSTGPKYFFTTLLFVAGGVALYYSVHPFISTLERWSLQLGISTFVFVQWVAPFLSEFPEKVSAFNWARQEKKAPMALMNMVNSNINQWTMLAAMIPLVFNLSLGHFEPVVFDHMHWVELALTIAQSVLGGVLLLDMRFSMWDALAIFVLWIVQFIFGHLREEVAIIYCVWAAFEVGKVLIAYASHKRLPQAFVAMKEHIAATRLASQGASQA